MKHLFSLLILVLFLNIVIGQKSNKIKNIHFVDSVSKYKTIDDILLLPQFINKTVYIDYWATTCIPCIKEFAYSSKVNKRLSIKNVAFIYICDNFHGSINDADRKKWKSLVYKYKLEGSHFYLYIIPPNKVVHDIIDMDYLVKHQNDKFYGVPSYFIANKGKIIIYNAYRPSELEKLEKQIDSVNSLQKIF